MYPVKVGDCPSPEGGILGTFIGDHTLKIALLSSTLLNAREGFKIIILFHYIKLSYYLLFFSLYFSIIYDILYKYSFYA